MAIIPLRFFPRRPTFRIVPLRRAAYAVSIASALAAIVAAIVIGLNLGIDFRGGALIEARFPSQPEISELRGRVSGLNLGEITIQEFGEPTDVLIRLQRQTGD